MHFELLLTAFLMAAGQADEAGKAPRAQAAPANLQLQYARAKLRLAETNLKRIEQMNRRLKKTVPASVVAEFRSDVEEAHLQVEQASSAREGGEFDVWLRRAENEFEAATTGWKKALAVNRRLKGTFEELDIQRFRLRAVVAKLQFERGQQLVGASREAQLEWQAELLNNEVDRLKEEQRTRVAPFVRYYPIYWW